MSYTGRHNDGAIRVDLIQEKQTAGEVWPTRGWLNGQR
jgi:hypothetical protein